MLLFLPEYVKKQLKTLHNNGFKAYVVGGSVRDLLMNRVPFDYDIATDALPNQIQALFERCIPTGIKHGTVSVAVKEGVTEITTFRTEGNYGDSRRPDSVAFVSDLESDLMRRDFTVNALAYNEAEGLIDLYSGVPDLKNKTLRAVGEPKKRFEEDALRIMRLFRFAAQLDFSIEEKTLGAALLMQGGLENISRERITDELKKIALSNKPYAILPLIENGGLAFLGIKELAPSKQIISLPHRTDIRLAAFLTLCRADLDFIKSSLKLSNKELDYLNAMKFISSLPLETKADIKFAINKTGPEIFCDYILLLSALKGIDIERHKAYFNEIAENKEPYKISQLDIDGHTLLSLGFKERQISKALNFLLELVINEPQKNNRQTLINELKRLS